MQRVCAHISVCFALTVGMFLNVGCNKQETSKIDNPPIIEKALKDGSSNYYQDFSAYKSSTQHLPVGVFDSGTGGLNILEKMLTLDCFDNITGSSQKDSIPDFAGEHFSYYMDIANTPYSNYPSEGKTEYLRELILKDALFLLSDKYFLNSIEEVPSGSKSGCKIIVIGDNTSAAYGHEDIRSLIEQSGSGVKVISVMESGVKATFDQLDVRQGDERFAIGVIATSGTIASGAYERSLKEKIEQLGITTDIDIVCQSDEGYPEALDNEPEYVNPHAFAPRSTYLGPNIGEGENDIRPELLKAYNFDYSNFHVLARRNSSGGYSDFQLNSSANYIKFCVVSLFERHRKSGSATPVRAIILGDTHLPFQAEVIKETVSWLHNYRENGQYPYRELIAKDLQFIDPALYTAIDCYQSLREEGKLALRITGMKVDPYVSVPSSTLSDSCITREGHLNYKFKFGRETGLEDFHTKPVRMSLSNVDTSNVSRIRELLPATYSLIAPGL